jgi:hypothetical protein
MDGRDFYWHVCDHAELEWLGARESTTPADDEVFVRHHPREAIWAVTVSAILGHGWAELEDVLTGRREPRIMRHIARIVGYYSLVRNWNLSKRAELRDRHRGSYTLPEPVAAGVAREVVA